MAAYLTVADIRAEGVANATTYPDAAITAAIARVSREAELAARTWWDARTKTFRIDGNGRDRLLLPQPCLSLTSVTIDGSTLTLATDAYLRDSDVSFLPSDELARLLGTFARGRDNLVVVGSFGACDVSTPASPVPPADLLWALKRHVVLVLPKATDDDAALERRMLQATSVSTDGRSMTRGAMSAPISGDPEVDAVYLKYFRPQAAVV